ncbi:MAG: SufD family Fe-S cluster assembly protein [Candidatus Moraniibacteriota bacterium]
MKYLDISHDKKKTYTLGENEKVVFFLQNRSGDLKFRLVAPGAEAIIYGLYIGNDEDRHFLNIIQHHLAPQTKSSALVKSVLDDTASFHYHGTIRIEKKARDVVATQENRNLLLSATASIETNPVLEILNQEVICHHAATTSAPKEEQIFALASRGISRGDAVQLIAEGFQKDILIHRQS